MKNCNHEHGDYVNGYWLCGQCYEKLHSRPVRYHQEKYLSKYGVEKTRQTVSRAGISMAWDGKRLTQFVRDIATRLVVKTGGAMHISDATDYAVELLRQIGEPFGSIDFDWSTAGAWEIVDEDMHYWEIEESRGN